MVSAVLLGAAIGALIFAVVWHVVPRRTSSAVQLARFDARISSRRHSNSADARPSGVGTPASRLTWLQSSIGAVVVDWLSQRGLSYTTLRQDLALAGRTLNELMGTKILSFAAGFLMTLLATAEFRLIVNTSMPTGGFLVVAVIAATGLSFIPDIKARRDGAAARRDFRLALSSYLDLVALEMAASAAPAEALPSAARIGSGWPMALIRETLRRATLSGQDHAEALIDLGQAIGVSELTDLGTTLQSVGRDGARARDTLIARAATMRSTRLANAESVAGQRDQSMLIAQILIGAAFVAFLLYPAIVNVMML
jgi:tight adherence protein C